MRCYDTQIATMNAPTQATASPAAPAAPAAAAAPSGRSAPPASPAATAPSVPSSPAESSAAAPAARASAAPAAAAANSPAAHFGEEYLPPPARPRSSEKEEALQSNITRVSEVGPSIYVIALANGQVWRQEGSAQIMMFFRVGDDVRIEKHALGSYHMSTKSTGAKNWVRVTRIQ